MVCKVMVDVQDGVSLDRLEDAIHETLVILCDNDLAKSLEKSWHEGGALVNLIGVLLFG